MVGGVTLSSAAALLERVVPAWGWLRGYRRADLGGDLAAGATQAVMLIPQAMAYALLAGLPPTAGLYASGLPLLAYAVFGSSRQLAVGPVAMISLLVARGLAGEGPAGSPPYLAAALVLAVLVGASQLLLGLLRLGFLANFISHGVISGFTSAAALVILLSQLKHLAGLKLPPAHAALPLAWETARHLPQAHVPTLLLGLASLAVLLALRRRWPRFPAPILVVVLSTLVVSGLGLQQRGVAVVGVVPAGLPPLRLPLLDLALVLRLLPLALTIGFVGYMESIAVAEMVAAREKYHVDPNRELGALGLANLTAAVCGGYPVTGGLSRTAVNYQAGARTGLASLVAAALVLLTVLFLTPLFHDLPQAVLAAIVIAAVVSLVDLPEARRLWRLKRADGVVLLVTFLIALLWEVDRGILLGALLSLLLLLWRTSHPHTAELGFVAGEGVFRNLQRYPQAQRVPGVIILRVDAALYFANMGFVEQGLRRRLADHPDTRWVLLDLSGVNDMDAVAVTALEELQEDYAARGVRFAFASMKGPVRDLVQRAGWPERFGERWAYVSLEQALAALEATEGGSLLPQAP